MKCAYCGRETKGTRDHIISSGILDLFPECYITFDDTRKRYIKPTLRLKMCVPNVIIKEFHILIAMQKISSVDTLHGNIPNKIKLKLNITMS